jgi:hypothetical protein
MTDKFQLRIAGSLILLVSAVFIFFNLSEFYITGIDKTSNGAYAFGELNENQWFYKDAATYAGYCLFWGIALLLPSLMLLYYLIKFRRKSLLIFSIITLVLVFLSFLANKV